MDDPHGTVERGYDRIAAAYARASIEGRTADTYFRAFLDRVLGMIPHRGRVLDLGCGAGLVAEELARRGRVVGVDRSVGQLALARARVPGASFLRADMTEVAFAAGSFDVVAAFWSLIHVRRELHPDVLARIRAWLRPGGTFVATLGAGDNPEERNPDFFGAPMYWSHFDAEANRRLLARAGFAIVQAEEREDEDEWHLWVIATA